MNNKKAFTLVELIATITILGVILLIAVPSYNKYVEKTRNKLIESYEKSVEDAAKAFVTDCIAKNVCANNPEKGINSDSLGNYLGLEGISLKTLQDLGFLKEDAALEKKINISIGKSYVTIVASGGSSETYSDLYQYTVYLKDESGAGISVPNKETNSTTPGENEQDTPEDSSGLILKNEKNEQISGTIDAGANESYTIYILNYSKFGNLKLNDKEPQNACRASASGVVKCNIDLQDGYNNVTIKDGETEKSLTIKTDIKNPEIALPEIDTEYTNKINFTITLSDNQKLDSFHPYNIEYNICQEISKTDSEIELECNITENGTYKITVTDSVERSVTKNLEIKNITSEKPSIVFDPNSGPLRNSGKITIEYSSGVVDGNYIGFASNYSVAYELLDSNNNSVSDGTFIAEEAGSGSFKINVGDDDCSGSACTGTYKLKIKEITNKAGNKITNVESGKFIIDNTPPKAANITQGHNATAISCGEIESSTGNRTCQVNFDGGLGGVPVTSELNFEVEDIGYSGAKNVYYRTATTGIFQETTIDQINEMKHKDFGGKTLNLYLEVVFADAVGNVDFNKNILKINFVKNELFD